MKNKKSNPPHYLYLACAIVMLAGLLSAGFNQWLASLWHGKRLAYVIAIGAALISYACFWLARDLELLASDDTES